MREKGNWIYGLLILALIFSCNSPKKQRKINDGKLFEKLKEQKGYLNAEELQRLERDFSLKILDKYDLSGYDEGDTLASFLRVDKDVWIASCYLENAAETHYPFFRLTETKEKGFKVLEHGTIPVTSGECTYELKDLLIRSGEYIFISQRKYRKTVCENSPLVFHLNGEKIHESNEFKVTAWKNAEGENLPFKNELKLESKTPESIVVHVHERVIDPEMEEEVRSRNYDLNFKVKNNTIYFRDTVFK